MMATGKELTRLVRCGIWKQWVENDRGFCHYQIFDQNGKPITPKEADNKAFCHISILFKSKSHDEQYMNLLLKLLRIVASTSNESMDARLNTRYGFYELVIS